MSKSAWKHTESAKLYQVDGWGSGYFSVNPRGNAEAISEAGKPIDLKLLCDKLAARGLHPAAAAAFFGYAQTAYAADSPAFHDSDRRIGL